MMELRASLFALLTLLVDSAASSRESLAFSHALHGIRCDALRNTDVEEGRKATCNLPVHHDRGVFGRRELLNAGISAAAISLAPKPASALVDFDSTLSIYGNDGDVPPSFLESLSETLTSRLGADGGVLNRRPATIKIPRTFLFRPFSVLLMRSSYETMDELDFVPTDKFQKEFFLLRSTEWEKYLAETDAKQGDLSDPMYFDFISAAQYATISQEMRRAQKVFEERTGAEGTVSVVRRDARLDDDDLLPAAFFERVGDKVYDALLANYSGPDFYSQPPQPCTPASADVSCVVAGLKQLYKVVVENGYALDCQVEDVGGVTVAEYSQAEAKLASWRRRTRDTFKTPEVSGRGRKVRVTLQVPCTLWGRQFLGMRGSMHNDHDVMVGMAYLRRSGQAATVSTTRVDQNSIVREYILL